MSLAERKLQVRKRLENRERQQQITQSPGYVSQQQWTELKGKLDRIFTPTLFESISSSEYMTCYNMVHCYVTARPGAAQELYALVEGFLSIYLAKQARCRPCSLDEGEQLNFYVSTFDYYLRSANLMCGMLSEANRLLPKKRAGFDDQIYRLVLRCWKTTIFQLLNDNVSSSILHLIRKSRAGEMINVHLISTVVQSYVRLGVVDSENLSNQNMSIYVEHFENQFLQDAEKFYHTQSESFLATNPCVTDFMAQIEEWLQKEANRVKVALHNTTLPKIVRVCENTLIQPHLELFYSNFGPLLSENKLEDLARLYNLVSRLSREYILQMSISFERKLVEVGREIVQKISNKEDVNEYFETIFKIYDQFQMMVSVCFKNDMEFRAALDKGCIALVNANFVATTGRLAAAMLAKFWDRLMKIDLGDQDIETLIDKTITIMKFLIEKDAFQIHYCMFLGNRLTRDTCLYPDYERVFVSKLGGVQGADYTSRMRRMLTDVATSEGLSQRFLEDCRNRAKPLPCVYCVQILTSGTWNYTQDKIEFSCPQWLENICAQFTDFYKNLHRGRALKWLNSCSHGELKYSPPSSKATYTFKVSTYQMAILLMYNDADIIQVSRILETTKLPLDIAIQVLDILLKYKILEKACKDEELTQESFIRLFMAYNNKNKKLIRINLPLRSEGKEQDDKVSNEVKATRKILLKAAIVRIMKTAKSKAHKLLVCDVIDNVKGKFVPNMKDIRDCIDDLIARDYIKRSEADNTIYTYIT